MRLHMNRQMIHSALVVVLVAVTSCSSSDESTTQQSAGQTSQRADTLAMRKRGTNFTTDQDTVVASVVKQPKTSTRSATSSELPASTAFTVQIGAFAEPQHALHAQRLAKERFGNFPVFNQFEALLKLYRVSIGKFESRDDAVAFLREMVKLQPKEYSECWINTIAK